MKTMYLFFLMASAGAAAPATTAAAAAQTPIGVDGQVPPALRVRPAAPPATGASLRAQALAKLEAQFRAADRDGDGRLSIDEAQGFGFVARHFEAIDSARRGTISFDELRSYLAREKAGRRPPAG